jgi:hypothetical protein
MAPDRKTQGIRIVRAGGLDPNTPQTCDMTRAAISYASAGAQELRAGTALVEPQCQGQRGRPRTAGRNGAG